MLNKQDMKTKTKAEIMKNTKVSYMFLVNVVYR